MNTIDSNENESPWGDPWGELHQDLLEIIFGKLWTGDQVRVKLVCKSWNRVLVQSRIPTAPEAPWEILSDEDYNSESCMTHVYLKSLSENRIYRIKLPTLGIHTGAWLCAHSHGWLVLAVGLNFLMWNPLTGATRKLPPLSTLPFFQDYVDFARQGNQFFSSVVRVEIFSIGSIDCVVAALFHTSRGNRIALCTTHEMKWIPFDVALDGHELKFEDILFHTSEGKLFALAINPFSPDIETKNMESKKFDVSVSVMDCQIQVVIGFINNPNRQIIWRLVESSITSRIIYVGCEGKAIVSSDDGKYSIKTTNFDVVYFAMGYTAVVSHRCVYFAMGYTAVVSHGDRKKFYISERGKYDLKTIQLYSSKTCSVSKIGWFMPQLFMS